MSDLMDAHPLICFAPTAGVLDAALGRFLSVAAVVSIEFFLASASRSPTLGALACIFFRFGSRYFVTRFIIGVCNQPIDAALADPPKHYPPVSEGGSRFGVAQVAVARNRIV
jgi:hypothetical protein